jgi:hypothetical protein
MLSERSKRKAIEFQNEAAAEAETARSLLFAYSDHGSVLNSRSVYAKQVGRSIRSSSERADRLYALSRYERDYDE